MKKLFVLVAAILIAESADAKFGIIGGLTSSKSDYKEAWADRKNVNQFHLGVAYNFHLVGGLALQPAIEYNMKGTRLADIGGVKDINVDFKTGYIEVPVQIQWGVDLKIVRPYVFAEPFIGYAISNREVYESGTYTSWDNVKNRFEYGLGLGVGVDLFKHVQVSVRYYWNMGKIYDTDITVGSVTKTIAGTRCNGIAATLGIFF